MKNKQTFFSLIVLLMAGMGFCSLFDAAEAADAKDLFISKCCNCHREGGEAPAIGPTYHASFQWKKFFEADRHSRRKDIKGLFTPEETEALKDFLMKHASDSDQPEGIGIAVQKGK